MHRSVSGGAFDRDVAVVLVKVGRYPLHHGSVGAARSLGRVGVRVYAIVEDAFTPAGLSRYSSGRFVWPTRGTESRTALIEGLARIGRRLPRRSLAVATDDEAAVLLAEHASDLDEWFLTSGVPPGLPWMLASKRGLFELCQRHGVPTPAAIFPSSVAEVESFSARAGFPVVVKNVDPWTRLRGPAVPGTTVVATAEELRARAHRWPSPLNVMVQEYIPRRYAEDWIFHGYFDRSSAPLVAFTGVKLRSWPPHAGVTTYACTVTNAELADQAVAFCRHLGYQGIVDMDWRFDRRDARYKLVDFNPRLGAQFRLFQDENGVDVLRAMHLDLTGRKVPPARAVVGRKLLVEHLDLAARRAYRAEASPWSPARVPSAPTERAWGVLDDPVPGLVMVVRFGWVAVKRMAGFTMTSAWRQLSRRLIRTRGNRGGTFGAPAEAFDP